MKEFLFIFLPPYFIIGYFIMLCSLGNTNKTIRYSLGLAAIWPIALIVFVIKGICDVVGEMIGE